MGRAAAFFDLDRTLIDLNSGANYARFEHREGRISTLQLIESAGWAAAYHLSLVDMTKVIGKAAAFYAGCSAEELQARTARWFAAEIAHRVRPGAHRALAEHRGRGEPLVLLTASSDYTGEQTRALLDLDVVLANRFELDAEGRHTGGVIEPICYGAGKVTVARAWADEAGIDLAASWFYTDSLSDLPMLEAVGHPVLVAPDPRLRRLGRRRGWPIQAW